MTPQQDQDQQQGDQTNTQQATPVSNESGVIGGVFGGNIPAASQQITDEVKHNVAETMPSFSDSEDNTFAFDDTEFATNTQTPLNLEEDPFTNEGITVLPDNQENTIVGGGEQTDLESQDPLTPSDSMNFTNPHDDDFSLHIEDNNATGTMFTQSNEDSPIDSVSNDDTLPEFTITSNQTPENSSTNNPTTDLIETTPLPTLDTLESSIGPANTTSGSEDSDQYSDLTTVQEQSTVSDNTLTPVQDTNNAIDQDINITIDLPNETTTDTTVPAQQPGDTLTQSDHDAQQKTTENDSDWDEINLDFNNESREDNSTHTYNMSSNNDSGDDNNVQDNELDFDLPETMNTNESIEAQGDSHHISSGGNDTLNDDTLNDDTQDDDTLNDDTGDDDTNSSNEENIEIYDTDRSVNEIFEDYQNYVYALQEYLIYINKDNVTIVGLRTDEEEISYNFSLSNTDSFIVKSNDKSTLQFQENDTMIHVYLNDELIAVYGDDSTEDVHNDITHYLREKLGKFTTMLTSEHNKATKQEKEKIKKIKKSLREF